MISRRKIVVGVVALAAIALWLVVGREPADVQPSIATARHIDRPPALRNDPLRVARRSISGTVRDATGTSIARARVCIGPRRASLDERLRCTDTNARGAYVLEAELASTMLAASAAGFRPHAQDLGDLTHGQDVTIDLTLEGGGAKLTGTVEDLGGGPIAHAMVSLTTIATETDDRGQFTLWPEPGIETWVTTTADGYGTRSIRADAPSNVLILLAPESTIRGRAIDAGTNDPIVRARVVLRGGSSTSDATSTITDEHGAFTFEQVAYGTYQIEASTARLRGAADDLHVGIGQHVDDVIVHMLPAHQVDVRVISEATCPHASVSLQEDDRWLVDPWRDADGWFHFDGVRAGRYLGNVSCDGVRQPHPYGPVVVAENDARVEWRTERGATIRGTVRWRAGGSIENATVEARSPMARPRELKTTREGTYEMSGLVAGSYRVTASADDHKSDAMSLDVRVGELVTRDLVLDGEPLGSVRGIVVDSQGRRLTTGNVELEPLGNLTAIARARVDSNGEFHTELDAGEWVAHYQRDSRPRTTRNADLVIRSGATTTARLVIPENPLREIRGMVVNADNRPIAGAFVVTTTVGAPFYGTDPITSITAAFADHNKPVVSRADGSFTLLVETPDPGLSVRLDAYVVGGGEATAIADTDEPVTLRLPDLASVEGRVTRADGSVPERVRVLVRSKARFRSETFNSQTGRYAIRDLADTSSLALTVEVDHVEHPIAVSLAPGEHKIGVDITVPAVATITGRVVDLGNGAPLPGTRLLLHVTVPGGSVWIAHDDQLAGDDGRFAISGVPPGRVAIEGIPPGEMWSRFDHVTVIDHVGSTIDIGDLGVSRTP